jgi:hypothetical protein
MIFRIVTHFQAILSVSRKTLDVPPNFWKEGLQMKKNYFDVLSSRHSFRLHQFFSVSSLKLTHAKMHAQCISLTLCTYLFLSLAFSFGLSLSLISQLCGSVFPYWWLAHFLAIYYSRSSYIGIYTCIYFLQKSHLLFLGKKILRRWYSVLGSVTHVIMH